MSFAVWRHEGLGFGTTAGEIRYGRDRRSPKTPNPEEQPALPEPAPIPVPPDLLAWARQTFDVREYLDGVRDIRATGGKTLESFIAEVEAAACGS